MVRGNRLSLLCASVVTMGLPAMVSARHMETWSPQELVDESDVIVVGEVESVIEGERIAEGETWRTPVVMMRAGVRVLRSTPSDGPHTPKPGSTITLTYQTPTPSGPRNISPVRLIEGDRYAFPLTLPEPGGTDWRLIGAEDYGGLLTPCIRQPTQEGLEGVAFLIHEHVGTLAFGDMGSLVRDSWGLRDYQRSAGHADVETLGRIHQGLCNFLDQGDDRWLDIAVAVCSSFGTPGPATITELLDGDAGRDGQGLMAALALSHVERAGIHERLIERTIAGLEHLGHGTWSIVRDNYADHPPTIHLLRDALDQDECGSVGLAEYLIRLASTVDGEWEMDLAKSAEHPLHAAAQAAACRWVIRPRGGMTARDYDRALREAVDFLQLHAGGDPYEVAMRALRDAKADDPEHFRTLGHWLIEDDAPRAIEVWRLCIDDAALRQSTIGNMLRKTGERFGWDADRDWDEQDWDAVAKRAKAWLAEQE